MNKDKEQAYGLRGRSGPPPLAVRLLSDIKLFSEISACPVKCLPREMRSIFHWGEAYFTGESSSDFRRAGRAGERTPVV